MKQFRNPQDVHAPLGAYTHQVELHGERLIAMSGQVGMDESGRVPEGTIAQLGLALDNVRRNLAAAGLAMSDVVKLTFYIVGEADADERRWVIASKLGDHRPCMTLLFVSSLATPALKVEVDAWASRAA